MTYKKITAVLFLLCTLAFAIAPLDALAQSASGSTGEFSPRSDAASTYTYSPQNTTGSTAAGVGSCGAGLLASALKALGISAGKAAAGLSTSAGAATGVAAASAVTVPVTDNATHVGILGNTGTGAVSAISSNALFGIDVTNLTTNNMLNCVARAIARAIIQQVVSSTVNWVNSGFNGSPSFITNPTQFFQQVADTAAGQYLQGSDLAFLCSPFSLQVKIAIAQSYQSGGIIGAPQCTLTQNLTGFMNNFQNGGWPSFIALTTNPANQPFGAYIAGNEGLNRAIAAATGQKQQQLALSGGFLDFQEEKNCQTYADTDPRVNLLDGSNPNKKITSATDSSGHTTWTSCDLVTVTPGKVISDSLSKSVGMNLDELNMAKYFDEIISALITQLMGKVMGSGGLLGLGGNYGASASDFGGGVNSVAFLQQQVLGQIPGYVQNAQTLTDIYNQDIAALQPAISTAQSALSCLTNANGYGGLTSDQQATVSQNLAAAQGDLASLKNDLSIYQNSLANITSSVNAINSYQSQVQNVGTNNLGGLSSAVINFTNASISGLPDASAITGAYEDQSGLQTKLAQMTPSLTSMLSGCQALNVPEQAPPPAPAVGSGAPACLMTFTPGSTEEASPSTLTWSSTNATAASIDSSVGNVAPNGSKAVTESAAGTYTFNGIFTGPGGTATCSATLNVTPPTIPGF